jgi:flagellar hook-length control protein FliK
VQDALQAALVALASGQGVVPVQTLASGATASATTSAKGMALTGAADGKPAASGLLSDGKGSGASKAAATASTATPTTLTDPAAAKPTLDTLAATAASSGQADDVASFKSAADAANAALAATQAAANAASTTAAAQTTGNASAAAVANALTPQVGTTDWEDALSQKVVFLSNAHSQSAELTLNPKDLGPLQVVLQVADNHAHALFVSQHQSVREAVEAALPKLREAMESNGIGLGSASVSDGFARQNSGQQNADSGRSGGNSGRNGGSFAGGGASNSIDTVANVAVQRKVGLVDTFA